MGTSPELKLKLLNKSISKRETEIAEYEALQVKAQAEGDNDYARFLAKIRAESKRTLKLWQAEKEKLLKVTARRRR